MKAGGSWWNCLSWLVLAGAALAPDTLVELNAVPALGRVAALLPADPADPAEELVPVALLGGEAALATGLSAGHLLLLGHWNPSWALEVPLFSPYPHQGKANEAC